MKLEDIKRGMKVELLGKHESADNYDNYDNIEDWFKKYNKRKEVQQIKQQGFGVVVKIEKDGIVRVSNCIGNSSCWFFRPSDLKPYEEEFFEESQQNKTPKEWLLTPLSHFIVETGNECITLGNGTSYVVSNGKLWCDNLNEKYNEDLTDVNNRKLEDIIKITYEGKVVWKRKEKIKKMTIKEIEKELGYKIAIVSE